MNNKKLIGCAAAVLSMIAMLSGCGGAGDDNTVTLWSSAEDYKNAYYLEAIQEKFPDYNIVLEYMGTSSIAAKVTEEGDRCAADILVSEDYGYLEKCSPYLAEIRDFDYSVFLDELVPASHLYTPESKQGGCIIINPAVLAEKGVPVPASYEELLDPIYKGLISMPSPASSGTGYMFLRQLTNEWGEDAAFDYFAKFSDNVLQYTPSGSGPVNALIQGEAGIGLGMTAQAVKEINDGVPLEVLFFEEGSPQNMYGNAILKKSADRKAVTEVFTYLATELCREDNIRFFPDQIYKDFVPEYENYPADIHYGDMSGNTLEEKERLLKKWTFS